MDKPEEDPSQELQQGSLQAGKSSSWEENKIGLFFVPNSEEQEIENEEEKISQSMLKDEQDQPQTTEKINYPDMSNPDNGENQELTLQFEPSHDENNFRSPSAKYARKNNESLLISPEDEQLIPSVALEPSPKGQKPIEVLITTYRTTIFMKMQTQIFSIQVKDINKMRNYSIQRRYSDFVELYEALFYNQPGYILCPFPGKGLESFLKFKLGLGASEAGERYELIEKRMSELEKFLDFLAQHQQLRNSEELQIFLQPETEHFQSGKKRLQNYVEEYKGLQKNSHIKTFLDKGKSLWSSYFHGNQQINHPLKESIGRNQIEFRVITEKISHEKQKIETFLRQSRLLEQAERNFSNFSDFETENDILLKVCAKQSSSRDYCRKYANFLQTQILEQFNFSLRSLEEAEKSLLYRMQIVNALQQTKKDSSQVEKKQKLDRRLQIFENNFLKDWEPFYERTKKRNQTVLKRLKEGWCEYKNAMQKIWRKKS